MHHITFTELRTKAQFIANALRRGEEIKLIRRSRVVGRVVPERGDMKKINAKKLEEKIKKLGFPRLTLEEIDRRYRIAMMKKHGQGLS